VVSSRALTLTFLTLQVGSGESNEDSSVPSDFKPYIQGYRSTDHYNTCAIHQSPSLEASVERCKKVFWTLPRDSCPGSDMDILTEYEGCGVTQRLP